METGRLACSGRVGRTADSLTVAGVIVGYVTIGVRHREGEGGGRGEENREGEGERMDRGMKEWS